MKLKECGAGMSSSGVVFIPRYQLIQIKRFLTHIHCSMVISYAYLFPVCEVRVYRQLVKQTKNWYISYSVYILVHY